MKRNIGLNEINRIAVRNRKIRAGLQILVGLLVTVIAFFPMYWMIITSLKSQDEVLRLVPTFWPHEIHFENYKIVFNKVHFGRYYFNTIIMTFGIIVLQILTGIFAAYGFSKGKFKGQGLVFMFVLGALMIPIQVTFIPIYMMCAKLHFTDSFAGQIGRASCRERV